MKQALIQNMICFCEYAYIYICPCSCENKVVVNEKSQPLREGLGQVLGHMVCYFL